VSLQLRAGEIVAIAGVAGNGQRELGEVVAGMRPLTAGALRVQGKRLPGGDPRAAFDAGVRFIPEDRLGTGLAPSLTVAMNLDLRLFRRRSWGPFLRVGAMRERAETAIRAFDIRASGPDVRTDYLSGGNLQKVVIARELSGAMHVLIAASPTRGLDVAAAATVHRYLIEAAEAGVAVLLVSEDLDEILALNDRVLVMYEGALAEVDDPTSVAEIGLRMAGAAP
jgi:simple sugar transport system ATP-binding protein